MCKHNSCMEPETCAICLKEHELSNRYCTEAVEATDAGMDDIDREAERIGRHMRGWKFSTASRRRARGGRRNGKTPAK